MQTLIALMGGPNTTEQRLDTMFVPGLRSGGVGAGGLNGAGTTLFNPGSKPYLLTQQPFPTNPFLSGQRALLRDPPPL